MELLDVYDKDGNYLKTEDRKIVHKEGLWHKTVHCWLYDKDKNVYFQIRSKDKTLYTTSSGHAIAGETIKQAFGREIFEELGLKIDYEQAKKLKVNIFMMDKPLEDGSIYKDRAFANVYTYEFNGSVDSFSFKDDEVDGLMLLNAKQALELLKTQKGTIKGTSIKSVDGKIVKQQVDVSYDDFLVNAKEDGYTKYGYILESIIN